MQTEKLLLIPGPSPVHPRIINSLSLPTVSHVSPEFTTEFKKALRNLKKTVFTEKGEPFIVSGAGTLAMEMALVNTLSSGEKLLVVSQGYFGARMNAIAGCFGVNCDFLESPWGEAVRPEKVAVKLDSGNYQAAVFTHVDTCTGACAPIKGYADVLKGREILFILDGVCATGGIEERMDRWGIDVLLTAAQKCYGAPPGLSILVVSERAMEKRRSMKSIPAYYADLLRWLLVMRDPSKYFSTPCVNEIRAFYEATEIMIEEGMENRFARHEQFARAFRAALRELGFSFFTEEAYLADTLTVVNYMSGIMDTEFRRILGDNGVIVAGGLAETAGKVFRMGHMGNLSQAQVLFAVDALEKTLQTLGYSFSSGAGRDAADKILKE
ncbi:MAG: alanine--glyoxylate aminotransferase family protein [Candidatus Aminicenantes bacterium]|nr:alanine--glyoxylate aminotransferase family protein [Candidatus Aminicenantes bacterium]